MCNVKELLREINKEEDNNPFFTAIKLTNSYLTYSFKGTEHDLLKKKYANYIFVYLLEECQKLFYDKKIDTNVFKKAIQKARENTLKYRQECYFQWLENVGDDINVVEDKLVQSLLTFFTLEDKNEVLKLLGIERL